MATDAATNIALVGPGAVGT
ncbi:hypothetical protein, partial [Mycobacterium senriense]